MNDDLRTRVAKALCETDGLTWETAAGRAEARLRKIEHGCETPESHNYGCLCDEPIEFRGGSIKLHQDPMTAELRFDAGPWSSTVMFVEEADPAPVRQVGLRIDGPVWTEFLRAAYESKPASMRLEETARENEELRTTIISQAREIARLKGESA